jgi:branched-chain amino acid transport system substrate-binding protein
MIMDGLTLCYPKRKWGVGWTSRGNRSVWSFTLRIAALLCLVLDLPAPGPLPAQPPPIRIGEIDPLTGKLAKHGAEIHEGIVQALEEVNERGGILGRRVELVFRDDQSQPETAINQAEDLLYREKVLGLVGGYVDSLVAPVSEIAAKHRIPYVASASLQRSLTRGRENPFFFRVAHLDGVVRPLCGFVVDALQAKSTAILYSATPGSTEFGEEVRSCLEAAHLPVTLFEKFRPGSHDFSAFLLKARQANVDTLICGGFLPDHLMLVRQLREQRVPIKHYIGPWGVAYASFIEEIGPSSDGLLGMCAWNPGMTRPGTEAQSEAFVRKFQERFKKSPNSTTMHGYASARALLAAIEKAAAGSLPLTGEAVAGQLRSVDIVTPMERLAFDAKGDPKDYHQVIVQIQNGKMVAVYPPERATGKLE